eukprot:1536533-Alexandrium_andersonii.AAC.1
MEDLPGRWFSAPAWIASSDLGLRSSGAGLAEPSSIPSSFNAFVSGEAPGSPCAQQALCFDELDYAGLPRAGSPSR